MDLKKLEPVLEEIVKDVLVKTKYPYGFPVSGQANKKASGSLINSMKFDTEKDGNYDVLTLSLIEYGIYVDGGREKGHHLPKSAILNIVQWIKDRNINLRDTRGRLLPGQQKFRKTLQSSIESAKPLPMAYAIANSIAKNGIRPTNFVAEIKRKILDSPKVLDIIGDSILEEIKK